MLLGIILAAGRGKRLAPLTDTTPKPLMTAGGKTLLEWTLDKMVDKVDGFVLVVSYLGEQIEAKIGDNYRGKPVQYVTQKNPTGGTLDALRTAIYERKNSEEAANYWISNSDDLHGNDIWEKMQAKIEANPEQALVAAKILEDKEKIKNFGVYEIEQKEDQSWLVKVHEKPQEFISNLINIGVYYFPAQVVDLISQEANLGDREEYITEHLFNPYLQKWLIEVVATNGLWLPITSVADLELAKEKMRAKPSNLSF